MAKLVTNADIQLPATTEDLRTVLGPALSRYFGVPSVISCLERTTSQYSTSYPLEEITVTLQDGRRLEIMFKNLHRASLCSAVRQVKPAFLYHPLREIDVYRHLLADLDVGTACCYAALADDQQDRYWLFMEKVPGMELYQLGDLHIWQAVARWLATFHAKVATNPTWRARTAAARLIRHDRDLYQQWLARARSFAGACGAVERARIERELDRLAAVWDVVTTRAFTTTETVIHGELYASNVLVHGSEHPIRVCPVDWEMAGVGPALLDLSALTSGSWSEADQRAIALAYHEAAGGDRVVPQERFLAALDCCRALVAVQWLGWACEWSPPAEHRCDWVSVLQRSLDRLEDAA